MNYESLYLLDLKSGERVREEELFKEGYAEPVAALIREYAEKKYSSEGEEDFTYDLFTIEGLVPNGCCGVSEEGITWNYQPYEIASYAAGVISVTVPWRPFRSCSPRNNPRPASPAPAHPADSRTSPPDRISVSKMNSSAECERAESPGPIFSVGKGTSAWLLVVGDPNG